MSLGERDRKIVLVIAPVVLIVAFWFLLLAPKREEAATLGEQVTQAQADLDVATSNLAQLDAAKKSFANDYTQLVRLGKAIPSSVDMPSLIVQLDSAAKGTGIDFNKISVGEREAGEPAPAAAADGSKPPEGADAPSGQAASPAGAARDQAQGAAGQSNAATSASDASSNSAGATDTQTSTPTKQGGLPVGGGAPGATGASGAAVSPVPGLDRVPLQFTFKGSFFDLADFMHRLKRFVRVANERVVVRGRLMAIDGIKLAPGDEGSLELTAEVAASVYLAPKSQGVTAGATPNGPAPATSTPASTPPSSTPPPAPPTAAATR